MLTKKHREKRAFAFSWRKTQLQPFKEQKVRECQRDSRRNKRTRFLFFLLTPLIVFSWHIEHTESSTMHSLFVCCVYQMKNFKELNHHGTRFAVFWTFYACWYVLLLINTTVHYIEQGHCLTFRLHHRSQRLNLPLPCDNQMPSGINTCFQPSDSTVR